MPTPRIQIAINCQEQIEVYWDFDRTGYYKAFNLYGSVNSNMTPSVLIKRNIFNAPDTYYDKNKTFVKFDRSLISSTGAFYIQLKGIIASSGLEDSFDPTTGPTRVPALSEIPPYYSVNMMYRYTGAVWVPY